MQLHSRFYLDIFSTKIKISYRFVNNTGLHPNIRWFIEIIIILIAATPRLKNPTADEVFTLPILDPEPAESNPRLRIAVKLPDGNRIYRYFSPDSKLQVILDFASREMQENLAGYHLKSPDKLYTELSITIQESNLKNRTLLYLDPPS